jgi:carboxypeptidase C (cathepsin A)
MLFLESPVGVGFSYSDVNDYNNSDDRTARDNREAIEVFFKMFPQYINNNFYITGENNSILQN